MKKKIPVHIITGFLGAGKTTFLNHFLKIQENEKIVVIENEIGKINIDGASLVSSLSHIVELTAGCICCSLNDELFDVLEELYVKKDDIDRILIETTGIADPGAIAATFLNHPAVIIDFELINVIAIVDAHFIEIWLSETEEAVRQIASSDIILVNKTDHIKDEKHLNNLTLLLTEINPLASVEYGSFGHFNMDLIWQKQNESLPEKRLNELSGKLNIIHGKITTFSYTFSEPFVLSKLNFELNRLLFLSYNQIYRMKGLIAVENYPVKILFQTVKNQINYSDGQLWEKDEPRESKLVVIGKNINKENMKHFFQKCLLK
jgi:G3E family GTPase